MISIVLNGYSVYILSLLTERGINLLFDVYQTMNILGFLMFYLDKNCAIISKKGVYVGIETYCKEIIKP